VRTTLASTLAPLALAALAMALAGCGLGAGKAPSAVQLRITRDFGARVLRQTHAPKLRGQETVMSLLIRNESVTTRFGGGFVQSIDGLAGGQERGRPVDWFYYVNGIEARRGAASTVVRPGDHIWWDRHDWSQTDDVPAVVGSFPEPFLNGTGGKRLPVRIECADVPGRACRAVATQLRAAGVPAAIAAITVGGAPQTLRVMVGPWPAVAGDVATREIAAGPRASGVYARFGRDGATLSLLDQDGRTTRRLVRGAGLIAATRHAEDAPVWVVSGTDTSGVELAARAFNASVLRDRFAVALTPAGAVPLPDPGGVGR
jgi:Domain of unknown function (DUF4430)